VRVCRCVCVCVCASVCALPAACIRLQQTPLPHSLRLNPACLKKGFVWARVRKRLRILNRGSRRMCCVCVRDSCVCAMCVCVCEHTHTHTLHVGYSDMSPSVGMSVQRDASRARKKSWCSISIIYIYTLQCTEYKCTYICCAEGSSLEYRLSTFFSLFRNTFLFF